MQGLTKLRATPLPYVTLYLLLTGCVPPPPTKSTDEPLENHQPMETRSTKTPLALTDTSLLDDDKDNASTTKTNRITISGGDNPTHEHADQPSTQPNSNKSSPITETGAILKDSLTERWAEHRKGSPDNSSEIDTLIYAHFDGESDDLSTLQPNTQEAKTLDPTFQVFIGEKVYNFSNNNQSTVFIQGDRSAGTSTVIIKGEDAQNNEIFIEVSKGFTGHIESLRDLPLLGNYAIQSRSAQIVLSIDNKKLASFAYGSVDLTLFEDGILLGMASFGETAKEQTANTAIFHVRISIFCPLIFAAPVCDRGW
ncbi:MAG: hypothetical protein OXE99_09510 [Cellvibrionales bacterium]|nr:hypothetical protein [Cellvibrionales bacterium]